MLFYCTNTFTNIFECYNTVLTRVPLGQALTLGTTPWGAEGSRGLKPWTQAFPRLFFSEGLWTHFPLGAGRF
jgi:hypothetical protein